MSNLKGTTSIFKVKKFFHIKQHPHFQRNCASFTLDQKKKKNYNVEICRNVPHMHICPSIETKNKAYHFFQKATLIFQHMIM